MRFDVLTLFPEMIDYVTGQSIIGRAKEKGIITVNAVDIRDFSQYKSKKVDDYPYGGGSGMVIMANPVYDAYRSLTKDLKEKPPVVYLTPQGKPLTQQKVISLSELDRIILLCGHYEGIDERVIEEIVDDEISIGDYVVTGGELPALIL
ncbi:MAG: tRNA (guanosine(37)-N1)-methyltransferase TrmD, partial [Eubacteriales bacterium]|nr:tRNA (guanosine(37)-N1)-methyltransferase TrmD [Eubacteriales bacterium]